MTKVLNSEEYKDWSSETRTFGIECDKRIYYEDLFGSIRAEQYAELIQSYSNQYFSEEEVLVAVDSVQYDQIFEQLGMKITVEQLGFEIARLSKMIGTSSPL